MRFVRATQSDEQRANDNKLSKQREAVHRQKKQSKDLYAFCNAQDVMKGKVEVLPLHETEDSIGTMSIECSICGALKFKFETKSACCNNGKILLPPFPTPPPVINDLLNGQDRKSVLFRKHARAINNAVSFTSLNTGENKGGGYQPCVKFQGKIQHRIGPLKPNDDDKPRFAQLYVNDPELELTERFNNLNLPVNMSKSDKDLMKEILADVQKTLHEVNPFVKDLKQIMDLPLDDIVDGKIVITAKKPSEEHKRRYNQQLNLQEVSILTNSEPNDIVLNMKGGGLKTISNLNPKSAPLRFPLLFPYGTPGWHPDLMHTDGKRRVTPMEYHRFHMRVRNRYPWLEGNVDIPVDQPENEEEEEEVSPESEGEDAFE